MSAKITREMLFSTGSSESQSSKGQSGGIVELDLGKVIDSPYQPRMRRIERRDVEDLMSAIEAAGQVQPIIVSPADDENEGKYFVHAGHRRCAALRFLGRTSVRADIRRLSPREAQKLALAENLGREDLSGIEQAEALSGYAEKYELSLTDAARELGLSDRTRKRLGPLLKAPEHIRDELLKHGISARVGELVTKLERVRPGIGARRIRSFVEGTTTIVKLERELKQINAGGSTIVTNPANAPVHLDLRADSVDLRIRLTTLDPNDTNVREAIDAMERCLAALRNRDTEGMAA